MKSVRCEPSSAGMLMARCRASERGASCCIVEVVSRDNLGRGRWMRDLLPETTHCRKPARAESLPALPLRTCSIQAPLSPGE